jgi:hypothetical protein
VLEVGGDVVLVSVGVVEVDEAERGGSGQQLSGLRCFQQVDHVTFGCDLQRIPDRIKPVEPLVRFQPGPQAGFIEFEGSQLHVDLLSCELGRVAGVSPLPASSANSGACQAP